MTTESVVDGGFLATVGSGLGDPRQIVALNDAMVALVAPLGGVGQMLKWNCAWLV